MTTVFSMRDMEPTDQRETSAGGHYEKGPPVGLVGAFRSEIAGSHCFGTLWPFMRGLASPLGISGLQKVHLNNTA